MKPQEQLENAVGSKLPAKVPEIELQPVAAPADAPEVTAVPNAFTTAFRGRINGVVIARGFHAGINANSRVLISISEFGGDRFIGSARMAVYNIAPFNGGFAAWLEISWPTALNVHLDVFVDP